MRISKTVLLVLAVVLLGVAFPVDGTTASLKAVPAVQVGMIFFIGRVQQYLLTAGEPFKLMILGAGLILLAIRLRQRTPAENKESQLDSLSGGLS